MMLNKLSGFLNQVDAPTKAVLFILSSISGLMTYGGMAATFAPEDNLVWWKAVAAILAGGISVAIAIYWTYAFAIAPNVLRARHRVASLLNIKVFLVVIFFLSSTWNVSFLAWEEGRRLILTTTISVSEKAVAAVQRRIRMANTLIPDVRSLQAELQAMSEAEAREGAISGAGGCSGVCNTLANIARSLSAVLTGIATEQARQAALLDKANSTLIKLRTLQTANGDIETRLNRAGDLIALLNDDLSAAQSSSIAGTISRAIGPLADSFIVSRINSENQRESIANIRKFLSERTKPVTARADEINSLPPVNAIVFARPNALKSTFVHFTSLIAQWMAGICLDLLPAFLLAFRLIASDAVRAGPVGPNPPASHQWTVAQLLEVQDLLERFKADEKPVRGASRSMRKTARIPTRRSAK